MSTLSMFEGVGLEIEWMIVNRDTLDVAPIADQLMAAAHGSNGQASDVDRGSTSDVDRGDMAWSNELVLHVLEAKTNGPASSFEGLARRFQSEARYANELLSEFGAQLLPTGMHPWMDPMRETKLWPHEYSEVYRTLDRIFGCSGHGWSNLQSTHINFPYKGDAEFGRLHAAIRLVLPLIPALTASSPAMDGRLGHSLDMRLTAYRNNCFRVPSVTGHIIPEIARSRRQYEQQILGVIYEDLRPHDPKGVLRHEWVNARGAIPRFDRGSIEIRLMDTQEHPAADVACAALIYHTVQWLVEETDLEPDLDTLALASVLNGTIKHGDQALLRDRGLLKHFDLGRNPVQAGDAWTYLRETVLLSEDWDWTDALDVIEQEGCLSRRIRLALGKDPDRDQLKAVYRELGECLDEGRSFSAEG